MMAIETLIDYLTEGGAFGTDWSQDLERHVNGEELLSVMYWPNDLGKLEWIEWNIGGKFTFYDFKIIELTDDNSSES